MKLAESFLAANPVSGTGGEPFQVMSPGGRLLAPEPPRGKTPDCKIATECLLEAG